MRQPGEQFTEAEQFEAFFNSATIGIIVTDRTGAIINFNQHASKQFGYSKEEVTGKTVDMLIPDSFRNKHEKHREGFYKNPGARVMGAGRDLFALKKDGTEFPVEISLSTYGTGSNLYVIAFIIDITIRKKNELVVLEQKQALEESSLRIREMNAELENKVEARTIMLRETLDELERSREELSEALQKEKELSDLKSRFVTMASHEFRTPLSTIQSSAYLLEQYNPADAESEKRSKHLKRIKTAVDGLKNILEDFLSLGKLEEGSVRVNMESLSYQDAVSLMDTTVSEMKAVSKSGQQLLFTHAGGNSVWADPGLVRNLLINLLSNAIKFSGEDGVINILLQANEKNAILQVQDNGIGISEEDQQHLFERFFRAKNASNIQGTGLGLNIVARYVELMGGSIALSSELNKGTNIIIDIPAA